MLAKCLRKDILAGKDLLICIELPLIEDLVSAQALYICVERLFSVAGSLSLQVVDKG